MTDPRDGRVIPLHDARRRGLAKAVIAAPALLSVALPAAFSPALAWAAAQRRQVAASPGYGKDPALKAGAAPWPRLLTEDEITVLTALANAVLPTDASGPGALDVGVPAFLDEWCSAPYPDQQADLALLRAGVQKLAGAAVPAGTALDALLANADTAHDWLRRVRTLVIVGWGTTPQAAPQLGFVGNEPRLQFDGPPPVVLQGLKSLPGRR